MSDHGIDYGMGQSNIDRTTGIRFGVISARALADWALEEFEADYGPPTCRVCGNNAQEYESDVHGEYDRKPGCADYACQTCERVFESSDAYGDEPLGHNLDDGEYVAQLDSHNDVFVTRAPYFTHAQFCSPCAPGACHLNNPTDDSGPRCYCFGHDWFEDGKAPYPVYRVSDGSLVNPE